MKTKSLIISLIFLALTCVGCDQSEKVKAQNKYNSLVDKALVLYHSGDYVKSLACFEKSMMLGTDNDKAYLYAALICDEMMNDPHKAKLYYEKFINVTNDIEKRELAKNWLNNLYGKYCEYKPVQENERNDSTNGPKIDPEKLKQLKDEINQLNKQNDNLKRELVSVQQELYDRNRVVSEYSAQIEQLKTRIASGSIADDYKRQVSNFKGDLPDRSPYRLSLFTDVGFYEQKNDNGLLFNKYIVKAGESLNSISRKVYGDEKYWSLLKETNKFQLLEDGSICEGQILIIPKLPEQTKS